MSRTDPMRELVDAFPEMLEAAWETKPPDGFRLPPGRFWLLGGMGGSGMAAAVGTLLLESNRQAAVTWRYPALPGWLDDQDRAVVVSYSGNTWEAEAMLDAALARSVPLRVVTCGGRIGRRCRDQGIPVFSVAQGMPPRAALPWLVVGVLRAVGGGEDEAIRGVIATLRGERDRPNAGRDPVQIAAGMEERLVVLLPVGPIMEVVATRWRSQILENAKQAALVSPLPEGCHNEVVGWQWLRDRQLPVSFFLLTDGSHAGGTWESAVSALEQEAARCGHRFHRVAPHTGGGLGSLFADLYLADRVSVELAARRGVPATPIAAIERIRAATQAQDPR